MEQKGFARKRRENAPTTETMINSSTSSTRYRRKEETKNILEYIHGGKESSLYGAWDYLKSHASTTLIEKLIVSYKRGKFIETVYGKFSNILSKSDASLKKAVATKYLNFFISKEVCIFM